MFSIGKMISSERVKRGLTREDLAERVGIATETLARYERGNRTPKPDTLEKLASIFNVATDYLMGRADSTTDTKKAPTAQTEQPGVKARIYTDLIEIPVVSPEWTACCGGGIGALDITSDDGRTVSIPRSLLRAYDDMRPPFAIECSGSCLENKGIYDGDIAVINPAETPAQGALALVSTGGTLSLKYVYKLQRGMVLLRCDDGDRRLTPDEQEDLEFWPVGTVVAISRGRPPAEPL